MSTNKIPYLENPKEFWELRKKAREERDKKMSKLPLSQKAIIAERLQADYEVLQNTEQFRLGDDACNILNRDMDFSRTVDESHFLEITLT